ncbi:glycosyltransferase 61 family protein [Psychrobacter piscatorii]|uniref:glycosyltransferase 61 family protein n=1 Tax=Psychrobacter piscatorii TaxID=554343 RepID=UPI00387A320C
MKIPDQSLCYFSHYHQEYTYPYQAIMDNINPAEHRKVYLSRTKFIKKDCINEEYFESFYRQQGFEIIYPEQLNIKEQISIISGADQIVSTIGTVSHLGLFAKKNAKIITLLRARNYFNATQSIVNQAKELDYVFVDVTCNFLPHRYSANCYYIGPNNTWVEFVKQEYNINLDINILDYLNSNNSHIGDYFQQWMKIFSSKKQLSKIQSDNSLDILNNLEVIFANNKDITKEPSRSLVIDSNTSSRKSDLFKNKVFSFSRYDGTYSRQILLSESGLIQTINGKDHSNESFWEIRNNELVFLSMNKKLTSRYFLTKEKPEGLFLLGYYEPNKEIIFKLNEVKTTGLRVVKKTKI